MNAADVIADAVDTATNCFLSRKHLRDATDDVVAALRAACGGGDIVIRTDGTLATLRLTSKRSRDDGHGSWSMRTEALDALCPKGERVVLDRTGDTDRLIRQRETALRGVWADIEDGPDE